MNKFFSLLLGLSLFSCQSNTNAGDSKEQKIASPDTIASISLNNRSLEDCYRYTAKRDTYDVKYTMQDNNVAGTMAFNNFEKDKSKGNIKGTISNDTLKIYYDFEAEGMHSVRQIYFKIDGKKLITGTADEIAKADSALIKNPAEVKFNGPVYEKIDCGLLQ